MNRTAALRIVVAALIVPLGCSGPKGPETARVWGDVSYDGQPVADGTIDFIADDGSPPAQGAIKAGHYDVPAASGPVVGKTYRVEISSLVKTGKTVPNVMGDGAPTMEVMANLIPLDFNAQSTLKAAIAPDPSRNQFDFKLAKVPPSPPR